MAFCFIAIFVRANFSSHKENAFRSAAIYEVYLVLVSLRAATWYDISI